MALVASSRRSIVLMLALLTGPMVVAQDTNGPDSEAMHYAERYAQCAAFFGAAVEALASLGDHKTALTYQEYQYGASMYMLGLALEGRDEEKAMEIVNSLLEKYDREMREIIDGRNENVSILIDRHHRECVDLVREPPE